jgi:hypothetical protein
MLTYILYETLTWVISIGISILLISFHIISLRKIHFDVINNPDKKVHFHMVRTITFLLLVHTIEIIAYGFLFFLTCDIFHHGEVIGAESLFDYFHFSAASYTSLGFGDLIPVGTARVLAGLEALVGLTMIGWTVTFTYPYIKVRKNQSKDAVTFF